MKINDYIGVNLVGVDLTRFLSELTRSNIVVKDICWENELCISISISRKDIKYIYRLGKRFGVEIKNIQPSYVDSLYLMLRHRGVLVISIIILMMLTLYLPTKVLFIEVEGNEAVPTKFIVETADVCGINFGASRKSVRSEKIKNMLLASLPDIQWAGVNTYGCRAVISVREKADVEKTTETADISSIVSVTDGIVDSIIVTKGNTLCSVGQAVKKGQVLVSAYSNLGKVIHATKAEGEIYGQTKRDLNVLFPLKTTAKNKIQYSSKKISIIFGKLRIKLYKDSGISPRSCDKIYTMYDLTLPGGLTLPVRLEVERESVYNTISNVSISDLHVPDFSALAERYLIDCMISGKVIKRLESLQKTEDLIYYKGKYDCHEMIGRNRIEEIINE